MMSSGRNGSLRIRLLLFSTRTVSYEYGCRSWHLQSGVNRFVARKGTDPIDKRSKRELLVARSPPVHTYIRTNTSGIVGDLSQRASEIVPAGVSSLSRRRVKRDGGFVPSSRWKPCISLSLSLSAKSRRQREGRNKAANNN